MSTTRRELLVDVQRRRHGLDDRVQGRPLLARYVHIAHSTAARRRRRGPLPAGAARGYHWPMAIETSPGAEAIRKELDERGVEFLFAQFVDMHGKPNAKLVPVQHLDDLLDRRGGLRRLRGGRHRPGPARPGHRGDAGPALAHAPAVAAGGRPLRVRRHGGGRAVAVLPAHHPAQPARARGRARLRVQDGLRARVLPRPPPPGRHDRARRPARQPRPALLRHARADPLARLRDRGRAPRQRARVGHLRHRPRGRQRAVRAELPVRRRARLLRPRGVLPLHGRVARAGARADGHVHAQAVRAPHRQRLPHAHEPVGRRPPAVPDATPPTTRAGSASPRTATTSSAA